MVRNQLYVQLPPHTTTVPSLRIAAELLPPPAIFVHTPKVGGIEVTNVYQVLDNALTSIQPSELKNAFETAVLIYLSRKITDKFDNQLKHISTLFGK